MFSKNYPSCILNHKILTRRKCSTVNTKCKGGDYPEPRTLLHLKRKLSDCIVLIVQWSSCETSALLAVLAYHWVCKKQAEAQWGIHIHVQSWKAFTLKGLFSGVLAVSQFYQRGLSDWKAFSFQTSALHCTASSFCMYQRGLSNWKAFTSDVFALHAVNLFVSGETWLNSNSSPHKKRNIMNFQKLWKAYWFQNLASSFSKICCLHCSFFCHHRETTFVVINGQDWQEWRGSF